MADQYPANEISLRNIGGQSLQLRLETGENHSILIGAIDFQSASKIVHPQAVYFHNGESFLVKNLDFENNEVRLEDFNGGLFYRAAGQLAGGNHRKSASGSQSVL